MTAGARQVLDDCKLALELLEQSPDEQFWRIHWFAAVILVRTVGDVLHKVDGQSEPYKTPVAEAYARWQSDRESSAIFWEFIKIQRNKLAHAYESDVHPLERVHLAVEFDLISVEDGSAKKVREAIEIDENIYRPMLSGRWEGDDGRDVLQTAIEWWEAELRGIESQASAGAPSPDR